MKKNILVISLLIITIIANSQVTRPIMSSFVGHKTGNVLKNLSPSTIVCTNYYVPGTTMNLEFTITISTPDQEYGDSISITFPTGVTPTGNASNPIATATQGQGSEPLNGVVGQTISWGDNDNSFGGVEPGSYNFFVEVNVNSGLTGNLTANFHISGDQYGTPADANGTIVIASQPTCLPSQNISLNNIQPTSAEISWTPGSASSWNLQYGLAGFVLGNGTIIYNVTNPYTITGLIQNTQYNVYIQDSCNASDLSPWSSQYTFQTPSSCPSPSNLSVTNISETGAIISWNSGGASNWNILFGEQGSALTFVNNVTNPYTLSGLTSGTIYEVYVQDSCGVGDVSIFDYITFQTTVNCPSAYQIPYSEGFEYSTGVSLSSVCWTNIDGDGDGNSWLIESNVQHSGTKAASSYSWNGDPLTPNNWLISPPIDLTSVTGSIALEYYIAPGAPPWVAEHYKLVASVSGTDTTNFTDILLEETLGETPGRYYHRMVNVSQYIGQIVRFAWVHYNCTDVYVMTLDDISVHQNTNIDLGVLSVLSPSNESSCDLGSQTNISVELFNYGGSDLSGFQITYTCPGINGGVPVTETVSQTVPASGSLTYTFTNPATLSGYDSYNLKIYISTITGDTDSSNDTLNYSFVSSDAKIQIHAFTDNQSGQSWYIKNILTNETLIQGVNWIWNAEVYEQACVFSDQCYEVGVSDVNGMLDGAAYLEILYNGVQIGGSTTPNSFTGPSLVVPYIGNGCPTEPDLSATGKFNFEYPIIPLSQLQSNDYKFIMEVKNTGAPLTSATTATVSIPQSGFSDSSPLTIPMSSGAIQQVAFNQSFVPSVIDTYNVIFSANAAGDYNPSNNSDTLTFAVTDTIMARENGVPTSGVGGGAGYKIDFAQKFKISASDYSVSSVSFMLAEATIGDIVKIEIYSELNGKPGSKLGGSADYQISDATSFQFHTVSLISPISVTPGNYYVVIRDVNCANGILIALSDKYYTQSTALVMIAGGPWSNLEDYGYNVALMLRMNLNYDPSLNINVITTNSGCSQADGTASLIVTGGTSPYTYLWSTGSNASSLTGLAVGTYFVQVSDASGTTSVKYFNISSSDGASITLNSSTNVSCFGGANGSIDVNVTGGIPPYEYDWSNGATTQDITNVSSGFYELMVTDNLGCASSIQVQIHQPNQIYVTTQTNNSTCGSSNGSASVLVSGGTQPYSYNWSNGMNTSTISGLNAGSYKVTVTDNNGCTKIVNSGIVVNSIGGPVIAMDSVKYTSCGGLDGAIYISVQSIFSSVNYLWSNGSTTQDLIGVPPGLYTVNAVDSNGCVGTFSREITSIAPSVQEICIVTVDSATNRNKIMWEKAQLTGVDHYNIYREGSVMDFFYKIAEVPYDTMSIYVDMVANPNTRSWRYKISAVDLCGNESELSSPHKTLHLTINDGINQTVNLIWDSYEGFQYYTFDVWRFSSGAGWVQLDSLPANLWTYTDNPPSAEQLWYMVAVNKSIGCYPSSTDKSQTGPYSQSISNIDDYGIFVGINNHIVSKDNILIYPNPAKTKLNIQVGNEAGCSYSVKIWNSIGQMMYRCKDFISNYQLDINGYKAGLYFVEVINNTTGQSTIQKIVFE